MRRFALVAVLLILSPTFVECAGGEPADSSSSPLTPMNAGSSLSLGTVSNVRPGSCTFTNSLDCFTATVSCPGTADITVSVLTTSPSGTPKGTIFMHGGGGGKGLYDASNGTVTLGGSYEKAGYRVVKVSWASDWEDTTVLPKSIKTAACRPATILNYVFSYIHGGRSARGGMCAEGNSGGAGALAYALTEYNGSSYLDKVILTSGPVFSDIKKGCMQPDAAAVTICPAGAFGCVGAPWQADPQLPRVVGRWSGDSSCQATEGATSSASNAAWKAMSIVDGLSDSSFTYPQTSLSGYLCGNGLGSAQAQGGLYFQKFTGPGQTSSFALYRVDNCAKAEDFYDGIISAGPNAGVNALTVVVNDMLNPVSGCKKRH